MIMDKDSAHDVEKSSPKDSKVMPHIVQQTNGGHTLQQIQTTNLDKSHFLNNSTD